VDSGGQPGHRADHNLNLWGPGVRPDVLHWSTDQKRMDLACALPDHAWFCRDRRKRDRRGATHLRQVGRPVRRNQANYETFERMHWACNW